MKYYQGEETLRMKTIFFFLIDVINEKKAETMIGIFSKIIDIEIPFFVRDDQLLIAFVAITYFSPF